MTKTKIHYEKDIFKLKLFIGIMLAIIIINIFLFGFFNNSNPPQYTIQDNCLSCNKIYGVKDTYYSSDYLEMLERIKKDCGSTHFVYRDFEVPLNEEEQEWRMFTKDCKDGYCKSVYIKLEDCLK